MKRKYEVIGIVIDTEKEEEKCYLQIVNMVKENKINIGRINRSVKRILKLKQKYKLNNNTINGIRKY